MVGDRGKPVKDYSDLINPRVIPSDILAEVEGGVGDEDTLDLSEQPEKNRARSLDARSLDLTADVVEDVADATADDKLAMGEGNDGVKLAVVAKAVDNRRRRRDVVEAEAVAPVDQPFPDAQGVRPYFVS